MDIRIENFENANNPLDSVEEILSANNWSFNRMTDEELMVQVQGKKCEYSIFFIWQTDMDTLQFCCQYDLNISKDNMENAIRVLHDVNRTLWLGHFDFMQDSGIPSFRHTCLYRGMKGNFGSEHIEDLVDISLAQCERYYPVFSLLSQGQDIHEQSLLLAMMQTAGTS